MKNKIVTLMNRIAFPEASTVAVADALDKIESNREARELFLSLVKEYDASEHCTYLRMLEDMKAISAKAGMMTKMRIRQSAEVLQWHSFADF